MTRLVLPWPPTTNTYYRSIPCGRRTRVIISKKGREYRAGVASILAHARGLYGDARLKVVAYAHGPTKRSYDVDNRLKALLDAMQHAGVYDDDGQVDDLRIIRCDVVRGGRVVVEIREIEAA